MMKRTRTAPAPSGRATVASVSPLIHIILPLLILLLTVVATTTTSSSTAGAQQPQLHPPAEEDNADNDSTTATSATVSQLRLQQASKEYVALQSALDTKLQHIRNVRNKIYSQKKNLLPLHLPKQGGGDESSSSTTTEVIMDAMYDDMDKISSKVAELLRRTETVLARLGAHNKLIISGRTEHVAVNETIDISQTEDDNDNNTKIFMELEARLHNLMREEIERRDRYISITMASTTPVEEEKNDDDMPSPPPHYITLTELTQLISPTPILQHTESIIQNSLMKLTTQLMETHIETETLTWKHRSQQETPIQYEREYNNATSEILLLYNQQQQQRIQVQSNHDMYDTNGKCLTIPKAMELVARALVEHYSHGGTTNMVDHASYENGGSVVYELTSWAYMPPPRNNDYYKDGMMIDGDGGSVSQRELYELAKQVMFDEHVEIMYYQQQQSMNSAQYSEYGQKQKRESFLSKLLTNPLSEMFEKMNLWKWYTTFPLGNTLRQYLPEDWERLLDRLFSSHQVSSLSWSDYTPRGIVDVLIPDYVYHALGLENNPFFGRWFGRTVSPEVAISDGYGKSGGGSGDNVGGKSFTAMPLGHCYPLSMRPEDDPALSASSSLLNHRDDGGSPSFTSSLLIGPKYTVRLPYPIYIDAVTFEHRSFPLPPSKHNHDIGRSPARTRGGESAPRWIRVVGFPPCSTKDRDNKEVVDECGVLGFDVAKPIDLGLFEYQRITESDDDNGLLGEEQEEKVDETFHDVLERRRSVQTFAVKGGRLKPSPLLGNDSSGDTTEIDEEHYDSRDPRQCPDDSKSCTATVEDEIDLAEESMPVGQCAPPKDVDSMPSCGVDARTKTKRSGGGTAAAARERQIVEAVSFIFEENWGNREYTCLYRVRVHGDAVSGREK